MFSLKLILRISFFINTFFLKENLTIIFSSPKSILLGTFWIRDIKAIATRISKIDNTIILRIIPSSGM